MPRSLNTIADKQVGILARLTGSPSQQALVEEATQLLRERHIDTIIVSAGSTARDELKAWNTLLSQNLDGVIAHLECSDSDRQAAWQEQHSNIVFVHLPYETAGELAADHLLGYGHSFMAVVTGPAEQHAAQAALTVSYTHLTLPTKA